MSNKESPESLFRRLTQLFRSGPVVKRKIRSRDTTIAVPDKTKSSGTLLFQKSLSPTYATITSNAYNIAERMMRYQDFAEMEYTPELASALDIYADEVCAQDDQGRVLHVFSNNEKIKEILEDLFYGTLNVDFNMKPWARNLPIRRSTRIPLLDGSQLTIEELSNKMKENPSWTPWVYSVQSNTNKMVPGKVVWCDKTRTGSPLVRVWLDDGSFVDTTPDHEWILRDGLSKRAEDLLVGESLMPLYRSQRMVGKDKKSKSYETVYDPATRQYVHTHRLMVECDVGPGNVVHHKNFTRHDNSPDNLQIMSKRDHIDLHRRLASSYNNSDLHKQHNVIRRASAKKMWHVRRNELIEKLRINFDDSCMQFVYDVIKEQSGRYIGLKKVRETLLKNEHFLEHFKAINSDSNRDVKKALYSETGLLSLIRRATGKQAFHEVIVSKFPELKNDPWYLRAANKSKSFSDAHQDGASFVDALHHNHTVVRVERLEEVDDVFCMTVLGQRGEHDRHNFAVLGTNRDGEVSKSGVILSNCKNGDLFLYNDVSPTYGVINVLPVPVNEIEREENYDREDPFAVRFRWTSMGNRILENWEVSHFRLLGNDMFLPYGASVIEPARRIWRQLILIEDAMLVYRVVRAPERRVFYVDVANIPSEDVPTYIEQLKQQLKMNKVVDGATGRVDMRYNPMSVDEDYVIAVRGGESGTKIDTLSGGQNTAAVEDVAYIQKKMFAAIKIPKAYLGYDEALSSKATLAQEDIRFSRTINVIQKTIIAELNKIAIIHLYANGFSGDDLVDFTLRLSNPSTVAQQQKLELWRAKFDIANSVPEGMGSKQFVYSKIWGLTNEEIDQINEQRIKDKLVDAKIEALGGEGGEGEFGGGGGGGSDLFGGGEGSGGEFGEEELGGEELGGEEPAEETGEENAGEEPAEEEDDDLELLTSAEDYDDDGEVYPLKLKDSSESSDSVPVKASSTVKHDQYNRSRHRHHGASKTHIPDFVKMTGVDNESMRDPIGSGFLKSLYTNPLGESSVQKMNVTATPMLSHDIRAVLRKMDEKFYSSNDVVGPYRSRPSVISEGIDVQDRIDALANESSITSIDRMPALMMETSSSPELSSSLDSIDEELESVDDEEVIELSD